MNATMQSCPERELFLHGLADGELDAQNASLIEAHLATCAGCAASYAAILDHRAVLAREGFSLRAPEGLRDRIVAQMAISAGAERKTEPLRTKAIAGRTARALGLPLLSAAALAASLALFVSSISGTPGVDSELAAAHVRSLLASHLTDVASSDRHTVKPWFLGKLNFAPPVPDLEGEGFPLLGGRLDYIEGRVTPALVYRRHGHIINVFVWPASGAAASSTTRDGYNILAWTAGAFDYAAVSDLNMAELEDFRQALQRALTAG